jgi:hypothetical protein
VEPRAAGVRSAQPWRQLARLICHQVVWAVPVPRSDTTSAGPRGLTLAEAEEADRPSGAVVAASGLLGATYGLGRYPLTGPTQANWSTLTANPAVTVT